MYQQLIAEMTGAEGRTLAWIEAWMRLEHPTLDGLPRAQFRSEALIGLACIAASTDQENEALATSYGL